MSERVLYFSLNLNRKKSFYSYIKGSGICYQPKFSFDLIEEDRVFCDPRDLLLLIEQEEKKDSLHVIIDYVSCYGKGKEKNYADVLRSIIMCFPEVQFLFDETFVGKEKGKRYCYLNFLFERSRNYLTQNEIDAGIPDVFSLVLLDFHRFDLKDFSAPATKNQFILLLKGRNNIYDASNLRYAIRKQKFNELSVQDNYDCLNDSRCNHAAVVVDEEYHQAQFNSYCLYACGFRVFSIVSATELLWINSTEELNKDQILALFLENELKQFKLLLSDNRVSEDSLEGFREQIKSEIEAICKKVELEKGLKARLEKELQEIDKLKQDWIERKNDRDNLLNSFQTQLSIKLNNLTLLVRDYDLQFIDENSVHSGVIIGKDIDRNEVDYIRGAKIKEDDETKEIKTIALIEDDGSGEDDCDHGNPYWRSFYKGMTYFVSKMDGPLSVEMNYPEAMKVDEERKLLKLRGFKKPLEGIYAWSYRIPSVQRRYNKSRDTKAFVTRRLGDAGHSCPLDIYGIVRPMVHRAELYYQSGHQYRLAALLAGEAIGILNGFHRSLMHKAYFIQAVAENAMAMSLLGGDESMLVKDVQIRLRDKVKADVKRMISDRKDRFNLLNNIFNDCHHFCQSKEYFRAADKALSIMAHEREGIYTEGLLSKVLRVFRKKTTKKENDE